ncbi:hypothetical protein [Rhodothermus profundi]|uniref:Uncharacterized protein n=1 Tax=Rhodothermus profundi TaxID=633813 RepID=A0A1M6USM6_9BACT|nr:hypothetical protein [Rhodothermus profundi]SHK72215.1 hypothetical protein SAMN04488087_1844 [Rhodothermus profundi]
MPLTIPEAAREPLVQELTRFAASMPDPETRALYQRLLEAAAAGEIDETLDEALGRFLEVALQTGRIRHQHGPHEEKMLRALFHQTQRGRQILSAVQQANQALRALEGHTLRELTFTPQNPGTYRLTLATDQVRLTLEISAQGVWVENLTVG